MQGACGSSIIFISTMTLPSKDHFLSGQSMFHPRGGFLLALPATVSLPTFFQTKGFCGFYNGPLCPRLDILKLISITVFDGETGEQFFPSPERPFCKSLPLSSSTTLANSAIRVSLECGSVASSHPSKISIHFVRDPAGLSSLLKTFCAENRGCSKCIE